MQTVARRALLVALVVLAGATFVAAGAAAQDREFTGTIQKTGGGSITVESRRGTTMDFGRTGATVVTGAKGSWGELAKGDRVTVSWQIDDSPRVAYEIVVRE